jgi:hypothetical protein
MDNKQNDHNEFTPSSQALIKHICNIVAGYIDEDTPCECIQYNCIQPNITAEHIRTLLLRNMPSELNTIIDELKCNSALFDVYRQHNAIYVNSLSTMSPQGKCWVSSECLWGLH